MLSRRYFFRAGVACGALAMTGARARLAFAALPPGQKVSVIIGIIFRMGVQSGQPLYQTRYDLNANGRIDVGDLQLALNLVPCHDVEANAPSIIMTSRAGT